MARILATVRETALDALALTGVLILAAMALGVMPALVYVPAGMAAGAVAALVPRSAAASIALREVLRVAAALLAPGWAALVGVALGFALLHPLGALRAPGLQVPASRWVRHVTAHIQEADLIVLVLVRVNVAFVLAGVALGLISQATQQRRRAPDPVAVLRWRLERGHAVPVAAE